MKTNSLHSQKFFLMMLFAFVLVQGCNGMRTDRKLYGGTGGYTGELHIYRVDDAWAPNGDARALYKIGDNSKGKQLREWVPVRKKNDVSGLDGPDRLVTSADFVKVSLKNVFIKYFREAGKKGEMALIFSLASGEKIKEDLLIYASKGQTLGTSLALDDITIIGPEKLAGPNLRIRVVMIEIDKIKNESMQNLIKQSIGIASEIQPQYAPAIKIAGDLAQFIISSNEDDIIFDQTFELSMTGKGKPVDSTPLLYGNYILLLQEDRFQSADVSKKAPVATRPPAVDDMRFNMYDHKLYTTYIYRPMLLPGKEKFTALDYQSPTTKLKYDLGSKVVDMNQFYLYAGSEDYEKNDESHAKVLAAINANEASEFRHRVLAFPKTDGASTNYKRFIGDKVGDYDIYGTLGDALKEIYCESVRYNNEEKNCEGAAGEEWVYPHYPIYLYPQGYAILAQYPFHTHIVFSVSRVMSNGEKPAEDRLISYASWLDEAMKEDTKSAGKIFDNFKKDVISQALIDKVLKKVEGEADAETKKCVLVKAITSNNEIIEKNLLLNELFHLTGDIFTRTEEVKTKYGDCLKKNNGEAPARKQSATRQ